MTPQELAEIIDYDALTGKMTWKARGSRSFDNKLAGKPALAQPSGGYQIGRIGGQNLKAHRVAWAIHYGEWPGGMIDHINGDRSDNRISNLRVVDALGNAQNQSVKTTNTSGEPCISWFARDSKWWVKITRNGRAIHIGFFDEMRDAVIARDAAYRAAGFHKNHGRR